jgi:hypothetical protein
LIGFGLSAWIHQGDSSNHSTSTKELHEKIYQLYNSSLLLRDCCFDRRPAYRRRDDGKRKSGLAGVKDKKSDDFKKLVSANVVAVYAEGMSDMQKELADMQKWDMKSFAISDYKVTPIGPNLVISTYRVKVEGTYEGKDMSGTYNDGSVWKKQKGEWQAVFHTNMKEAPAPAPAG